MLQDLVSVALETQNWEVAVHHLHLCKYKDVLGCSGRGNGL